MTALLTIADQWQVLSRLLDEALALPPEARPHWLQRLAGDDVQHRAALEMLLATQARIEGEDFLSELPVLKLTEPAEELVAGATVGPYRLIQRLGAGGMGLVWEAERADGLGRRRVALKLPRAVWGDGFAARLERERDILARLEHENIARLYDAGFDERGRPYLAMELIDGKPITAYCEALGLDVRSRVALLVQTAAAVSYAHARLVVHRDLKPSNIIVSRDGQVRLLDFGVAKLLEEDSTRATALTELSGRALTLDYASPEQIAGLPLGTGSDLYSLAVVAYETFTGHKPYRLKRGTAAELEEAIASAEVAPASTAAEAPATRRQLQGDLDAILNRALKKRPEDRYPTVDAFAQDLQRFLDGAPVQARPDRWSYRAAKFVYRHRLQVAAGGVVAVALVAGTSVAVWQAHQARLSADSAKAEAAKAKVEAATAQAVQGFLESVFKANSKFQPDPKKAGATTARELLDRGAERIATALASEPEAQLRLYYVLGEMYGGMGQYDRALGLFRRAVELGTQLHGPTSDATLRAASASGHMLDDLGQREEALATLLKVDAAAAQRTVDNDAVRMQIDADLARLYNRIDLAKALERARRAGAIARALGPSLEGIDPLQILGEVARTAGRLEEARETLTEVLDWTNRLGALGVQSFILAELGKAQDGLGQLQDAGDSFARAAALAEQFGDTIALHNARFELARFQLRNGLLHELIATAGQEVDWARRNRHDPAMRHLPALILANYGRALLAYGHAGHALTILDEARTMLPPETTPALLGQFLAARAGALVSLKRLTEAGAELERATAMIAGRSERVVEEGRVIRRQYLVAAGKADEALQDFRAYPSQGDGAPVAATPSASSAQVLAGLPRRIEEATLLLAAGDAAAARRVAARALEAIAGLPERRFASVAQARLDALLGEALLREWNRTEALPVLRKALAQELAVFDPVNSPLVAHVRKLLARAGSPVARAPIGPMGLD